jgi:hypothetical protein
MDRVDNQDSTFTISTQRRRQIVITQNEVPEYNRRNNAKSLGNFSLFNKPKFIFLKI